MPDDLAALVGLRAEMAKLAALITSERTPRRIRLEAAVAIAAMSLKIVDTALATLRAQETAPVFGDDLV